MVILQSIPDEGDPFQPFKEFLSYVLIQEIWEHHGSSNLKLDHQYDFFFSLKFDSLLYYSLMNLLLCFLEI